MQEQSKSACWMQWLIIVSIPLAFTAVLGLGFGGFVPLKVELHTLLIVALICFVFLLFARHNASIAVCSMRKSIQKMEERLHRALKENALTIMGKTKSTLRIRPFFEEYYKSIRNDNVAGIAPSVFPMLGILGTFVAIAISMPDFTVQDSASLDREISVLLSGIGTAFYASIYGILLSLIWLYFEKRGLSKADSMIHDMERLYDSRIWKESELVKHEHMQAELHNQEVFRTLKEIFNPEALQKLNEHYITSFTTAIKETSGHFETLTKQLHTAASQMRHTLESLEERRGYVQSVDAMEKNLERFVDSAQRLESLLERFDGQVENTLRAVDRELAVAVGELGRAVESIARLYMKEDKSIR